MKKRFFLILAGLMWFTAPAGADDAAGQVAADEQILKNAHVQADGEALLKFFRRRTLAEGDRGKVRELIQQLGSESYRLREQAAAELIARGPVVAELLRAALKNNDLEIVRRAQKCLHRIQETDYAVEVPAAAARLLKVRKPAGAIDTLLTYLPFADNEAVAEEVRNTLAALAVVKGRPDKTLTACLTDKDPLRRSAAAEALCRAGGADLLPALRKLMDDPDPGVRFRVAMALAFQKETRAVSVLIDLLPRVSLAQAWQIEDLLLRLGEENKPPAVSLGNSEASRNQCRDAWARWWKEQAGKVDLARLREKPRLLGYTLVVLLDQGQVMELNADQKLRWQIDGLAFPLDVQFLPGDRVLVAEYHASRVTERNTRGEILWEKRVVGPLVAQRLPNGNTFIATDAVLMEVDAKGDEAMNPITLRPGERIMKAMKLANGEIACLTTETRVVRLDAKGKELFSFPVPLSVRLFGGRIHMLANGHVLIPDNGDNKVVEYGAGGKPVWEVKVEQPIAATRLPNGNTLVTTMLPNRGAVEFDRHGKEVWQFRAGSRVTRALRR